MFPKIVGLVVVAVMVLAAPSLAQAADAPVITIVTTNQGSSRVSGEGSDLDPHRPGWQIELFRLAAEKAGIELKFVRTVWKNALDMIKSGEADAAFNSSFRPERAVYGVYPTVDGELDPRRATLNYAYWLYAPVNAEVPWNGSSFGELAKPIAAERNASIVPALKKSGAAVIEADTYQEMLELLSAGEVVGVASFEGNLDVFLATAPQKYNDVQRHPVPLVRKTGYLMYSKHFYDAQQVLAEKYWEAIADVWSSPEATEIRRRYE